MPTKRWKLYQVPILPSLFFRNITSWLKFRRSNKTVFFFEKKNNPTRRPNDWDSQFQGAAQKVQVFFFILLIISIWERKHIRTLGEVLFEKKRKLGVHGWSGGNKKRSLSPKIHTHLHLQNTSNTWHKCLWFYDPSFQEISNRTHWTDP